MIKLFQILCITIAIAIIPHVAFSQTEEEIAISPLIDGTLLISNQKENTPLVILIAGSGPTDRNGNQNMMKSNSFLFLAQQLEKNGISSFRYDKRIVKQIKQRQINEQQISFADFISDAKDVITYFKNDSRFSSINVIGHSQGSLVGMVAAQIGADSYISIAGAGQPIDDVIVAQLYKQAPGLAVSARNAFDEMRANGVTRNYNEGLASIFRPNIQPFMLSWMQYDPNEEIKKLSMPILIINGTKDLQVHESEAELLHNANPKSKLVLIENMNHIFKNIQGDDIENSKSYNDYKLPIEPKLVETITQFILE